MRVLLIPHSLEIGGAQIVALEMGAELQQKGNSVTVLGQPGPLVDLPQFEELQFESLNEGIRPSRSSIRLIREIVEDRSIDVVHCYESVPTIESILGARKGKVPVVVSVMSMKVSRHIPKSLPIIVGTNGIEAALREQGYPNVHVIEPPVSIPKRTQIQPAANSSMRILFIGRLDGYGKKETVEHCMRAVASLAGDFDAVLEIVGGGDVEQRLRSTADEINLSAGKQLITMHGSQPDPFPFYEGRQVVLGLGHSALRGMGMGIPTIVVDAQGFSEIVSPDSIDIFLERGFVGDGGTGTKRSTSLQGQLRSILESVSLQNELGQLGATVVARHFSPEAAGDSLEKILAQAIEYAGASNSAANQRAALRWFFRYRVRQSIGRA